MTSSAIPNRSVFRAQEVCEIAQVQPYVLKGWEAEFPDLGMAKTANGQRVYRRGDVERVLRLKDLLFKEGLTLSGARRRLAEEGAVAPVEEDVADDDVAALLDQEIRQHLRDVKRGLQWVLSVLDGEGVTQEDFVLMAESSNGGGRSGAKKASASGKGKASAKTAAGSQKAASRGGRKSAPASKRAKSGRKSPARPKAK